MYCLAIQLWDSTTPILSCKVTLPTCHSKKIKQRCNLNNTWQHPHIHPYQADTPSPTTQKSKDWWIPPFTQDFALLNLFINFMHQFPLAFWSNELNQVTLDSQTSGINGQEDVQKVRPNKTKGTFMCTLMYFTYLILWERFLPFLCRHWMHGIQQVIS